MKVVVLDGQGGRIGKLIVEQLMATDLFAGNLHTLVAVGTNTIATAAMLKAGAPQGATGENPATVNCADADVILGPVGIIAANSLLGEVTPRMAYAVAISRARKILIPTGRCSLFIAGTAELPLTDAVRAAVSETIRSLSR